MPTSLLITGGARSGKSRYAQRWCEARPGPRTYIATAGEPADDEMRARIARHRSQRDARWADTVEAPLDPVGAVLVAAHAGSHLVLLDCVTLWLTNLGFAHDWDEDAVLGAVDRLAAQLAAPPLDICLVTNEVGDGIVPDNALARRFRDLQGWANQRLADAAPSVVLVVCGQAMVIKPGATASPTTAPV